MSSPPASCIRYDYYCITVNLAVSCTQHNALETIWIWMCLVHTNNSSIILTRAFVSNVFFCWADVVIYCLRRSKCASVSHNMCHGTMLVWLYQSTVSYEEVYNSLNMIILMYIINLEVVHSNKWFTNYMIPLWLTKNDDAHYIQSMQIVKPNELNHLMFDLGLWLLH